MANSPWQQPAPQTNPYQAVGSTPFWQNLNQPDLPYTGYGANAPVADPTNNFNLWGQGNQSPAGQYPGTDIPPTQPQAGVTEAPKIDTATPTTSGWQDFGAVAQGLGTLGSLSLGYQGLRASQDQLNKQNEQYAADRANQIAQTSADWRDREEQRNRQSGMNAEEASAAAQESWDDLGIK